MKKEDFLGKHWKNYLSVKTENINFMNFYRFFDGKLD